MLIHRDGWLYSGRTPAFFTGQAGCFCCGIGIGSLVSFYGLKSPGPVRIRDVDSYVIDSWTSKADGTTPERESVASGTVQGIAYLFGGVENTSPFFMIATQSYVLSTDTFTSKASMSDARCRHVGVAISDYVYSFTGLDSSQVPTRSAYQYDPSGNSWSTKTDTPTPKRQFAAGFALSGKGYVVGGVDDASPSNVMKDNDEYDPTGNSWTSKTDCSIQRLGAAGMSIDGKGYFILGNQGFGSLSGACEEYDASGNSWTTKANLNTTVPLSLNRYYCSGASPGNTGEGFVTAGFTSVAVTNHDEYSPSTNQWTVRASIPAPGRYLHNCAESV